MPFNIACPSCGAKSKAPDALVGKTVKCPGCGNPFLVKPPPAQPSPVVPRPVPAPVPRAEVIDDLEEVEDDAEEVEVLDAEDGVVAADDYERPRARFRGRPDDEDDRPRSRKKKRYDDDEDDRPRARRRDDEDEEDEDYPRPRKKKPRRVGGVTKEERSQALILYILAMVLAPIGPLIFWMLKREESRFIDHHGRSLMNFWLTLFLASIVLFGVGGSLFCLLGVAGGFGGALIGWLMMVLSGIGLGAYSWIFMIMGCVKANRGEWYDLPALFHVF